MWSALITLWTRFRRCVAASVPEQTNVTPLHCTDHPPRSYGIFRASLSICLVDFIPSMFHVLLCEFQRKILSSGQAKIPTSFRLQQFCCTRVFVHLVPIIVPRWGGTQYLCAVLPCHRVFQRVNSSCFYSRWVYIHRIRCTCHRHHVDLQEGYVCCHRIRGAGTRAVDEHARLRS